MATALIVGAGSGLSASLARKLAARGHKLVLAARNTDKLIALAGETGAATITCDASKRGERFVVRVGRGRSREPVA